MPLPLLKLLFLLVSLAVLLLILLYVSLSVNFPLSASPSFFPTSAIISLAEDNSTFFLSKPAAFGPLLPKKGMTGELFVLPESELGCDDASPDGFTWRDDSEGTGEPEIDERTDDHIGVKSVEVHADIETMQQSAEINGKIVLVARGGCGFYDKVLWSQRRGAMAVIVGDNEAHRPLLTMYAKGDTSNISIPAIFTSYTTAHLLTSLLPKHSKSPSRTSPSYQKPVYSPSISAAPEKGGFASYFSRFSKSKDAATPRGRSPYSLDAKESSIDGTATDDLDYVYGNDAPARYTEKAGNNPRGPHDEQGNSVTDGSVALEGFGWLGQSDDQPGTKPGNGRPDMSHGLWITLTPTRLSSSPFVDTLLVLVVSPVITLTVVYTMLLLRSRYRRRRWRAPKSIVDQLPVHTYQPPSDPPSPSAPKNIPCSPDTPRPHSEKSTPDAQVASSFPDINQPSSSSSHFSPLSRVVSAPPAPIQNKQTSKSSSSRRNMRILPGFKYFPPSPECVVCLEEYVEGVSQVMRLPCGHEFHVNCITPWLTTRRRTCPVCKCDVVKALGGGNGYAVAGGDEESSGPVDSVGPNDDRPVGGAEGRGERGISFSWRVLMATIGVGSRGDNREVGETTPLIHDEDERRRD
ncbi:hypothetical protein Dda_0200 [Drechslerella dactyloides]|uniref:RING-type domain-containing protein n=1 Tax=Drechslerella dactyloides TaxID=74499 RepID=A0AAD6J3W9_DREDA|nr:hypothetical protein Dda_0200 [Drechslerella dactyloides]